MSQEEMKRTSRASYNANQKFKQACKQLDEVLESVDLKMLQKYPHAYIGEMSRAEFEAFVEAVDKLPDVVREHRETGEEWERAQEEASAAYNRHNGID